MTPKAAEAGPVTLIMAGSVCLDSFVANVSFRWSLGVENMAIVNKAAALERLGGDFELYDELVELYCCSAVEDFQALKDGLIAGDYKIAQRHAHSLKAASGNIGAEQAQAVAFAMEMAAKAGNADDLNILIESFATELKVLKEYFNKL